jgi:hypothetical protein
MHKLNAPTEKKDFVETKMTGHGMATRQMQLRGAHFVHENGRRGIFRGTRHRLEQTGNPLRPEQHFTSLYTENSVCTQFPTNR